MLFVHFEKKSIHLRAAPNSFACSKKVLCHTPVKPGARILILQTFPLDHKCGNEWVQQDAGQRHCVGPTEALHEHDLRVSKKKNIEEERSSAHRNTNSRTIYEYV